MPTVMVRVLIQKTRLRPNVQTLAETIRPGRKPVSHMLMLPVSEDPRVRRIVPSASPEMVTKASLESIIASVKETVARVDAGVASYILMKIFNIKIKLGQGIISEPQVTSVPKIRTKMTNASFLTGKPVEGGKFENM
jgi:hypothetical protein